MKLSLCKLYIAPQCCNRIHIHKKAILLPRAHRAHNVNKMENVSHFKSPGLSPSPTTDSRPYSPLYPQDPRPAPHCRKRTHRQPTCYRPAYKANITISTKQVSQSASRHLSSPPAASVYAYSHFSLQAVLLASHCRSLIHNKPTGYWPAHDAHTTANIKHVSHFASRHLSL